MKLLDNQIKEMKDKKEVAKDTPEFIKLAGELMKKVEKIDGYTRKKAEEILRETGDFKNRPF